MKEPHADEPRVVASSHDAASSHGATPPPASVSTQRAAPLWTNLLLVALGLASLALYRYGLNFDKAHKLQIVWFIKIALAQCALYALAAWLVWRAGARRSTLLLVIVFAALFRLSVLFAPPFLSDDVYRYVWDGRVQAAGINPYRHVPAADELRFLRDADVYPNINRRDYAPTIYPPLAQMIFYLATRVSERVVWMKAVMVLFEAAGLYALAVLLASFKLPRQRVLLAAWHPLAVWEIASSGHLDALVICLVALALLAHREGRESLTGALLAGAVLVKLFPLVLLPAFYRRRSWRLPLAFCLTLVVGYLPYLSVGARRVLGFLPGYASEEGLQSGERFFLLQLARAISGALPASASAAYAVFAMLAMCALAAWCLLKREPDEGDYVRRAALLATTFTVLLSPHYTWYFAWLVPFLCFARGRTLAPLLCLSVAAFMLYGTWLGDAPADMLRLNLSIYLPPALLLIVCYRARSAATFHNLFTTT
ncbi:MAG TPA: glycosyltransferase family 87 protein [Pyrinomonadaceae bacterium]|nr:glycosyltransferase family 87 protein [Pyrinomonadaceae bacterium]